MNGPVPAGGIGAAEFAAAMARLGPFEAAPRLAVAVSGGADSLALALLAARWAGDRGGTLDCLTVDHGLRPESAAESDRVACWLAARGISHHILRWTGDKPSAGIQAAAREARYRLLRRWCLEAGVLHLLVAHHRGDQSETVRLRLERGSGREGLAGMSALIEYPEVRLVRPLLDIDRRRLRATLRLAGQDWIEDPSNADVRFARARLRAQVVDPVDSRAPRAERCRWEADVARLLGRCCLVDPAGFAWLDRDRLPADGPEPAAAALRRVLLCVGGGIYPPSPGAADRLGRALAEGRGGSLGGCRVQVLGDRLLVCREVRGGGPAPLDARPGRLVWDGRFALDLAAGPGTGAARLRALGKAGWAEIVGDRPALREVPVPFAGRLALPALADDSGIFEVPHLGYKRGGGPAPSVSVARATFRPPNALSGVGFCLPADNPALSLWEIGDGSRGADGDRRIAGHPTVEGMPR